MAPRRRPWGSRNDPVALGYEVERPVRDKMRAVADNMGVATSVLIEQMMDHLELTDQGIPTWWEPLPRDNELAMPVDEEATPITST